MFWFHSQIVLAGTEALILISIMMSKKQDGQKQKTVAKKNGSENPTLLLKSFFLIISFFASRDLLLFVWPKRQFTCYSYSDTP